MLRPQGTYSLAPPCDSHSASRSSEYVLVAGGTFTSTPPDDSSERRPNVARKVAITVLAALVVVALAACSAEDASLTLVGPESVEQDDFAWFDAKVTGATPILGFVTWYKFVDLDNDNYPDRNEVMETTYSGVDRLGNAHAELWLHPKSYFGDRNLAVPASASVKVRAQIEWSDSTDGSFALTEGHDLIILSD